MKILRYLIKMLVSSLNHAGAITVRLDLLPILVDPNNWEWKAEHEVIWKLADEKWQDFNTKWYGATESQYPSLVDPEYPSLCLKPLSPNLDISSSIVVPKSSNVFIWSLFDTREKREPKEFLITFPCFPVQTTSPGPIRYKIWAKEQAPLLTGLTLWTRNELAQGYVLPIMHSCPCLSAHYLG